MMDLAQRFERSKPFIGVISIQVGLARMDVLSKAALNQCMSNYVLGVYRYAVATIAIGPFVVILNRKVRPKMTVSTFIKILVLSLLELVIDQNLYFLEMKNTTATFAAAVINILPSITFVMACIIRLQKVNIRFIHSQAKVVGTIATVTGAMIMMLIRGPLIDLFWIRGK